MQFLNSLGNMLKSHHRLKAVLFIIAILFFGNLFFSIYKCFSFLPENFWELTKKRTNYVIIYGDSTDFLKEFPKPLQSEKILKEDLFLEIYQFPVEHIRWDIIFKLNPKEVKFHQNEDTIYFYFYKKIFDFSTILKLLYHSFIWTISVIVLTGFILLILMIIFYLSLSVIYFLRKYDSKKFNYLKEIN